MMTRFWAHALGAIVAAIALGASATPAQGAFITTVPSWNGIDNLAYFGEPNTATYGQTITVGATDTFLTDFSFRMGTDPGQISKFKAVVMQWDQATLRAVGPILYNSSALTNTGPVDGFNVVTITTNVNLAANTQYVLFFSASNFFDSVNDQSVFGFISSDVYSGGEFVFSNNGNDPTLLTSSSWTNFSPGDLAFDAHLSPVNPTPAPAGIVLFGLGFAGMGLLRKFRKGKTAIA